LKKCQGTEKNGRLSQEFQAKCDLSQCCVFTIGHAASSQKKGGGGAEHYCTGDLQKAQNMQKTIKLTKTQIFGRQ